MSSSRKLSDQPMLNDGADDMHDHVDEKVGEDCSLKAVADVNPAEREAHWQDDEHGSQRDDKGDRIDEQLLVADMIPAEEKRRGKVGDPERDPASTALS